MQYKKQHLNQPFQLNSTNSHFYIPSNLINLTQKRQSRTGLNKDRKSRVLTNLSHHPTDYSKRFSTRVNTQQSTTFSKIMCQLKNYAHSVKNQFSNLQKRNNNQQTHTNDSRKQLQMEMIINNRQFTFKSPSPFKSHKASSLRKGKSLTVCQTVYIQSGFKRQHVQQCGEQQHQKLIKTDFRWKQPYNLQQLTRSQAVSQWNYEQARHQENTNEESYLTSQHLQAKNTRKKDKDAMQILNKRSDNFVQRVGKIQVKQDKSIFKRRQVKISNQQLKKTETNYGRPSIILSQKQRPIISNSRIASKNEILSHFQKVFNITNYSNKDIVPRIKSSQDQKESKFQIKQAVSKEKLMIALINSSKK